MITPLLSQQDAKDAGLRYVLDDEPGISRKKQGKTFTYTGPDGTKITDKSIIERINKLAIPPAYTDVWICTSANGHIQATGKDARGRKQYRYHEKWREVRDSNKYDRVIAFGKALPKIRRQVARDLKLTGMPKSKILATIVDLMEKTHIRVGNETYAKSNHSYGLTTLRDKHVAVRGSTVQFEFKGKSGVMHRIELTDTRMAKIIKKSQDLPGYELFQYVDINGERHSVQSSDVNQYLQDITGDSFSAKDFRTWYGTLLAAHALQSLEPGESETQTKKQILSAIDTVAEQLGNTRAICRKCYVHPQVLDAYLEGTLVESLTVPKRVPKDLQELKKEEAAVVMFLQKNAQ